MGGRVTTADGRGIRNAHVVVTGNSLSEPLIATTGSFGYFNFDGLTADRPMWSRSTLVDIRLVCPARC